MANTTAPPRKRAAKKVTVTPDDFLRIERFLTGKVLIEREQEMRVLIRGTIAGVNIHMDGEGGIAKSLLLSQFAKCVTGARYFGKALQPGTPPEAVIGTYDYAAMAQGGQFKRVLEGYLPDAHIAFIDELLRSSGLMRDALMPMLNAEERQAEGNGGMIQSPLLVMVTAANTFFEPDDPYTQALADRITLMMVVEDIRADDSFKELLRRDHERKQALATGTFEQVRETITLEQLIEAQRQSQAVAPTPEWIDATAQLRRDSKGAGLTVSPRRWIELGRVCRANAWMAGRDEMIPEDLVAVEPGLWREKSQIPAARKLVQQFRGKFEQMAEERRAEAEKVFARIDAVRPQIEGTPVEEDPEQDVLVEAIKAMREVAILRKRVDSNITEAENEKRSADELRTLANEIGGLEAWATKHGLPLHQS